MVLARKNQALPKGQFLQDLEPKNPIHTATIFPRGGVTRAKITGRDPRGEKAHSTPGHFSTVNLQGKL